MWSGSDHTEISAVFVSSEENSFTCLAMADYFVSDFSFCFKDVFFGLFDYSKENKGKHITICFLLNFTCIKSGSKPLFSLFKIDLDEYMETRDVTVWKFLITIIVTKIITVISIITVLLKCAGDVQKVPTHKSLNQVLYLKINKQQHNH